MNLSFFESIYQHSSFKKEDFSTIIKAHSEVEFAKNDFVLTEGKVSNEFYLIESGLFRSYVIDFNGNEITTNFYGPGQILIEVSSLFLRQPTKENFQALSDCDVWKIDFEAFNDLYANMQGFAEWGRAWMSNQLFILKQRSINMLTQSATERYLTLITEQPEIIQQVPLKFIATYLGVTDTSLSRIRKEITVKK